MLPAAASRPALAVDQDAVAFPHVPDNAPAVRRRRPGRERRRQGVVLAAGRRPVLPRDPEQAGGRPGRLAARERGRRHIDGHTTGCRDVPEVLEQSVTHVDHRRGARRRGRARRIGRLRPQVRRDQPTKITGAVLTAVALSGAALTGAALAGAALAGAALTGAVLTGVGPGRLSGPQQ